MFATRFVFFYFCRVLASGLESCCCNYYKDGLKCKGINTWRVIMASLFKTILTCVYIISRSFFKGQSNLLHKTTSFKVSTNILLSLYEKHFADLVDDINQNKPEFSKRIFCVKSLFCWLHSFNANLWLKHYWFFIGYSLRYSHKKSFILIKYVLLLLLNNDVYIDSDGLVYVV